MTAVKSLETIEKPAAAPQITQPVSQNEALIRMIQEAAINPEIDLDRMERLFEMRERIMAKEAETLFFRAMAAAQAQIKPVIKNQKNTHTKSEYADLEAVSEAIQPIITEHGFSLTFSEGECPKQGHMRVICEVMHVDGHSKTYHGDVPIDAAGSQGKTNKTATQAYGSTKTYGRRYLKCDIFDVAIKGQDNDGNRAEVPTKITPDQLKELQNLINRAGSDTVRICNHYKIEALPDMNTRDFNHAVLLLKQRIVAHTRKEAQNA